MEERRGVPVIVMEDEPCAVSLPPCATARVLTLPVGTRQVTAIVGLLAVANVLLAFLVTARPIPAWLDLRRFSSDLDATFLLGAGHLGLACGVILIAARGLFRRNGRTAQLVAMGAVTLLLTFVALNRYWAHPVQQEPVPSPVSLEPTGIPLHGSLPGGR